MSVQRIPNVSNLTDTGLGSPRADMRPCLESDCYVKGCPLLEI